MKAMEETEERQDRTTTINITPQPFDVLLGKTKRSLRHTGNQRLVLLCQLHYDKYNTANKYRKTELSDQIVSMVHESGGQFLRWKECREPGITPNNDAIGNDGYWSPVDNELEARNKVAHVFRHIRAKLAKRSK